MSTQQERQAEAMARRIARERGMPEGLWEMCLLDAYMRLMDEPASPTANPAGGPDER